MERLEIDGLPVWWAEAPAPYTATLEFRVGHADERLPIRGITHLVEHLAIFGVGLVHHQFNGYVGFSETGFWAAGEPEEAIGFVTSCARSLRRLPFERLEGERRVLRTEAGGGGLNARLLDLRLGPTTFGLGNYDELGLRWLDEQRIAEWADAWFTAANAVVTLSGPSHGDLAFGLPAGRRMPDPVAAAIPAAFPVHVADGTGGVALSLYGERSTALNSATAILADRLRERLRHEAALAYAPYGAYDRLTSELVHVVLGSDCADHLSPTVQELLWRTVTEFAETGATEAELDVHRRRVREWREDPQSIRGELADAAQQELRGQPRLPAEQWLGELDAFAGPELGAAVADVLGSAILLAPSGVGPPATGFHEPRQDTPEIEGGREFLPPRPKLGRRPAQRARLSDEGITYVQADGDSVTLRKADLTVGIAYAEGSVLLSDRIGSHISIWPGGWEDGHELTAGMRDLIGDENVIPSAAAEVAGPLEQLVVAAGLHEDAEVSRPIRYIAGVLHEAETLRAACKATHASKDGLLLLTSTRLLWLHATQTEDQFVERAAAQVTSVDHDWGAGFVPVTVKVGSTEGELAFDVPPSSKDALVAAIRELVG